MSEQEYHAFQAISHFLMTREYKPEEFQAFGLAAGYVGEKLKEWEDAQAEVGAGSGSDDSDSSPKAQEG